MAAPEAGGYRWGAGGAGGAPRSEEAEEGSAFFMRLHPVSAPALGPPGSGQLSTAHPALLHGYLFYFLLWEKLSPGKQPLRDTLRRSLEMAASHSGALNTGLGQSGRGPDPAHVSAGPRGSALTRAPHGLSEVPACDGACGLAHRLPTPHAVCAPRPGHRPHRTPSVPPAPGTAERAGDGKQWEPETRVVALREGLGAAPQ